MLGALQQIALQAAAAGHVFLHAQAIALMEANNVMGQAAIKHAEIMILILVMNGVLQQTALQGRLAAMEHVFLHALTNAQLQDKSNALEAAIKHAEIMTAIPA